MTTSETMNTSNMINTCVIACLLSNLEKSSKNSRINTRTKSKSFSNQEHTIVPVISAKAQKIRTNDKKRHTLTKSRTRSHAVKGVY